MCCPAVYLHRWDSFPPELLRRVVSVLLGDWAYFSPDNASDCLRPIRATCTAWRSIIDADIKQLTVTVPSLRPACLAENFPNATHLDLSRYHLNSQDIFSVLEQLKLRSAVSCFEIASDCKSAHHAVNAPAVAQEAFLLLFSHAP